MSPLLTAITLAALLLAAAVTTPTGAAEQYQPTTQMAELLSQWGDAAIDSDKRAAAIVRQGSSQPTAARKAGIAGPNSTRGVRYAAPRASEPSLILGVRF